MRVSVNSVIILCPRKKTSYKEILLKNQCEPQAGVNLLLSALIPEWRSSCGKVPNGD